MATLGSFFQGESVSIGLDFGTYDISKIESKYVYFKQKLLPSFFIGNILRIEIPSSQTVNYSGDYAIMLVIEDSQYGTKKKIIGNIYFTPTSTISNNSINEGYNIMVKLLLTPTKITIESY